MSVSHVALGVLSGVTGGPASYALRLARALLELPDSPRLTVLTDRPDRCAGLHGADIVDLPMRGGLDRLRWQHVALPRALRQLDVDLYHDTKNALPRGLRVPAVVTVHDLAYHVQPETFGLLSRIFLRRATAGAVRRARRVVVPSRATADDVLRYYPHAAGRLDVVHHGIDPALEVSAEQVAELRANRGLPARYVLHVGTVQARKNIDLLVRVVRRLRDLPGCHDLRLVLAGRRGWRSEAAFAEIARDDTAVYLGEVSATDLPVLYAGAMAFASPSGYEGFGLAVADALAAGVPTLVSDRGSLPELCGTAIPALPLPDAADAATVEGQWVAALECIANDSSYAAAQVELARQRAEEFTWPRAAAATLACYRRALGAG